MKPHSGKQLALAFLFTGSLFLPSLWWVTAVRYVRSHHLPWRWIRGRWVILPAAVGAITWLVMRRAGSSPDATS